VLEAAGIADLGSLGELRLSGAQAATTGILTPSTALAPARSLPFSNLYPLTLAADQVTVIRGPATSGVAELKQTINVVGDLHLDVGYWAASHIVIAANTLVVLEHPLKWLTLICEKLTVGPNVTFTWKRPGSDERHDPAPIADFIDQTPYKVDPPRASTGWNAEANRRVLSGNDGARGRDGRPGGRGYSGENAPEMEVWLLELEGSPLFDLNGQDGQDGGRGERGQDGQDGDDGLDSHSIAIDCRWGPGAGGNGGDGGNGGKGGDGGKGGNGGRLKLYAPPATLLQYIQSFHVAAEGGEGGRGGASGNPGVPGRGGKRGNISWPCTAMGRSDGADGAPGVEMGRGDSGEHGDDKYPDAFSFLPIGPDEFNTALTRPAIVNIEPVRAYAGDLAAINGVRFAAGDTALVAGAQAETQYVSDRRLTFRIPAVTGGSKTVQVRQADGTLSFPGTVVVLPRLIRHEPAGRIRPGSRVTLFGSGFREGCRVLVNGQVMPDVQFVDAVQLACRIVRPFEVEPAAAGEQVTIKVVFPDGSGETNDLSATLATYRMLVLGDSVAWGQGLQEHEKFYSLIEAHVRTRPEYSGDNAIGFYKAVLAHSGARIGINDDGTRDTTMRPPCDGEMPTPWPTILQQCESFDQQPETVDLVVLDGGINDVNVDRILSPLVDGDELRRLTELHCYEHMLALLEALLKKYSNARVVVTGYYPIISAQSDIRALTALLLGLGVSVDTLLALGLGGAVGVGSAAIAAIVLDAAQRNLLIDKCRVFVEQSASSLRKAVDEAGTRFGQGRQVVFAVPRYSPLHSALAPQPWLYGINLDLTAQDGLTRDARGTACDDCARQDPGRVDLEICRRASCGHPNPAGAAEYAKAAIRALFPLNPEFLGYADLHTHLMAHLGFGGKLFWGQPDGAMDTALHLCGEGHGPGGTGLFSQAGNLFMAGIEGTPGHHIGGYPQFDGWPRYTTLVHQHMYVDWIRRAYDSGLRLLVTAAVNNQLFAKEFGGTAGDDTTAINTQIEATRQFVARHSAWMEIAYTPEEARRLIASNKLAVVLAIEVDTLGDWARESDCTRDQVAAELQRLYDLGVRLITPIHLTNNAFGGADIRSELFNLLNRFLRDDYFEVEDGGQEDVQFRLGEEQDDLVLGWYRGIGNVIPGAGYYSPPAYDTTVGGHVNRLGLTPTGVFLIEEMMRHGMLIDVDHMSQKAADATLDLAERYHYPVVSTHTSFRDLAWRRGETDDIHKLPAEKNKSLRQIERISKLGGIVAPLLNQGDIRPFDNRIANDAAGSSRSFAQAYLYAVQHMGGRGVAIGTDSNGWAGYPGPRFGPNAASGLRGHGDTEDLPRELQREVQVRNQSNGVAYDEPPRMYRTPRWESKLLARQAYEGELRDIWEAIFLGLSDDDIAGADLGSLPLRTPWQVAWIRNIALGIREPAADRLPSPTVIDTTLNFNAGVVSRGALYAKQFASFTQAPEPDSRNTAIQEIFDKVRPIWEMVERMQGANPPYLRSIAGERDFDVNVDGVAHFGLLPDFLRDLKNIGLTDQDLAPLLRSALDFTDVWAACVARAPSVGMATGAVEVVREASSAPVYAIYNRSRIWVVDAAALEAYGGWARVRVTPDGYLSDIPHLGWATLGGRLTSAPASVSWADGRVDVFVRSEDMALWQRSYDQTLGWQPWQRLGGQLASAPAVCSWRAGRLDVFARGVDDALWHLWYDNGWSAWESLGGTLTSAPTAVSWAEGRIDVCARGASAQLIHLVFDGTWGNWQDHGGSLKSAPAVCSWEPGRLDVFAQANDDSLAHLWHWAGWSQWESLGGVLTSAPAAVSWDRGRIDVAARGADAGLWHISYDQGWSGWEQCAPVLQDAPAISSQAPGRLDLFAQGTDGTLWYLWYDAGWKSDVDQ
jgi:microsomal dipeptidase-like Zn-dependent dipeptidase